MEDVLGSYALVLTMLMLLALVVWFCCSIVVSFLKMRQRQKNLRYKALLRENLRLKSLLADTAKEHRLRKVSHIELVRRKSNRASRNIA
jgi:Na+-transporting methylmalonyl-CoA/oxaloacetate decarboxylase gamma subunit